MAESLKNMATPPFRIPSGVSLVRINAKTGKLATPEDETVILEAFKRGTEPAADRQQAIVQGGTGPQRMGVQDATVGAGTGGLY
jgi:penicillin-binding protein 1A